MAYGAGQRKATRQGGWPFDFERCRECKPRLRASRVPLVAGAPPRRGAAAIRTAPAAARAGARGGPGAAGDGDGFARVMGMVTGFAAIRGRGAVAGRRRRRGGCVCIRV